MHKRIKGYAHIHSIYSYDGSNSIAELSSFFKQRGYQFIYLTEHADDFDENKMKAYVAECRRLSSPELTIVPGLEYRCRELVHILALGVDQYFTCDNPQDLISKIKSTDGLSVIAHPAKYMKNITRDLIKRADAFEVWNAQKDSRFIPNGVNLKIYNDFRMINPTLIPVGGGDIHSIEKYCELDMVSRININDASPLSILRNAEKLRGAFWTLDLNSGYKNTEIMKLKFIRLVMKLIKSSIGKQQ